MAGKTEYKNKFTADNYDRIFLTVPKGTKEVIEEKASSLGMSLNGYITSLIYREIGTSPVSKEKAEPKKKEMEIFLF